jgi:hypothetical protein
VAIFDENDMNTKYKSHAKIQTQVLEGQSEAATARRGRSRDAVKKYSHRRIFEGLRFGSRGLRALPEKRALREKGMPGRQKVGFGARMRAGWKSSPTEELSK